MLKRRRRKKPLTSPTSPHPRGLFDPGCCILVCALLTMHLYVDIGDNKFSLFYFLLTVSIQGNWFMEHCQTC
jgi:hypothetical protein